MAYVELQVTTHCSLLRGASSPRELFATAALLGHTSLSITDRNSLAGIVQAHDAAKATGLCLLVGCRLDLAEGGPSLLVYPTDRLAYGRLCRLLTLGKSRAEKGGCRLHWGDIGTWADGIVTVLLTDQPDAALADDLARLKETFGDRAYCALTRRYRPGDALRLEAVAALARVARVSTVATGDVLYHVPDRRVLQDVIAAIRLGTTVDRLGRAREHHAGRHLVAPHEAERLMQRHPDAVARTAEILGRCRFSLDELTYSYPTEEAEDGTPAQDRLEALTWAVAAERYSGRLPDKVAAQIRHELTLIERLAYAPYFLTVESIVRFARTRGILCQGRGSAANSTVCFVLGITSIDPVRQGLLFERFVSENRNEPPDIDVDFEHERREEVIQWVYETYGRHRAALCATVTGYACVEDVWRRAGVSAGALRALAGADAFRSLGLDRRAALWAIRGLADRPLDLFAAADAREGQLRPERIEPPVALVPMSAGREVVEDYCATGLSLRAHPLAFLRGDLAAQGYRPCKVLDIVRPGHALALAGLVLMRQKPGSAKGTMFITLEDETGLANLIVWPPVFERHRRLILTAGMMGVRGRVQRQGLVVHVLVDSLVDLTAMLRRVSDSADGDAAFPLPSGRGDEARSGGRDQREPVASKRVAWGGDTPGIPAVAPEIRVPTRNFR